MKRFIIISQILTLLSLSLLAQNGGEIDLLCQKALTAVRVNSFSDAKQKYNEVISLIIKNPSSDLVLNIPTELSDYIIINLAKTSPEEARTSAMTLLELQMYCIKYLVLHSQYNSQGDVLDDISVALMSMGYTLAEAGLMKDAEECCYAAVYVYQQNDLYTPDYPLSYERLGYLYSRYLKDYVKALYYNYEGFKSATRLYGTDSELAKQIFGRICMSYAVNFIFTDYSVEFTDKHKSDEIRYPSFDQIDGLTNSWDCIRNEIITSYGIEVYHNLLQVQPVDLEPKGCFGSRQWDLLYKTLASIYYGRLKDYEENSKELIDAIVDLDDIQSYFRQIIDSLCNHGYLNYALKLYDDLIIKAEARRDIVEMLEYKAGSLCYGCGLYDQAWKYVTDIANDIYQYKYADKEAYLLKISLLSGLYNVERNPEDALKIDLIGVEIADADSLDVPKYLRRDLYSSLASSYSNLRQYDKAIEAANNAIRIGKNLALDLGEDPHDPRSISWPSGAYFCLADNYFDVGRLDEAELIINDCLVWNNHNFPTFTKSGYYDILMAIEESREEYSKMKKIAMQSYKEAITAYFSKSAGLTRIQRSDYWGQLQSNYVSSEILSDFALKYDIFSDVAYDAVLLQKGFLLSYEKIIADNIVNSNDSILLEAYNDFKKAESLGSADKYILELEYMRLYLRHPEFVQNVSYTTWKDVQQKLEKGDMAIEFARCCSDGQTMSYAALLLQPGWDKPAIVRLSSEREMNALLTKGSRAYLDNDMFYSVVWERIEPYLNGVKRIFFSPDGALSQLNIEILQNGKGKPMNKVYDIYRVSSTADLYKAGSSTYKSATLFGGLNYNLDIDSMQSISRGYSEGQWFTSFSSEFDKDLTRKGWSYLPGTRKEVEQISGILDKESIKNVTIMADSGTEESFKALSGRSTSILHVATHGFYLSEKQARRSNQSLLKKDDGDRHLYPLRRCGLMMSGGQHAWLGENIPDGIDDGILTGAEIVGLNLSSTDLLVLSACQTGLGEIGRDGIYGLELAFKIAGVNTIIMSLWEVSDTATEVLMNKFYSLLAKGKGKRVAFDAAVEAVKKEYESPEYWAAFIMLD